MSFGRHLGWHMSLGDRDGCHKGGAPLHSTVARAGSPQTTLQVWPLCPYSWGWAHPGWGVGGLGGPQSLTVWYRNPRPRIYVDWTTTVRTSLHLPRPRTAAVGINAKPCQLGQVVSCGDHGQAWRKYPFYVGASERGTANGIVDGGMGHTSGVCFTVITENVWEQNHASRRTVQFHTANVYAVTW